MFFLPYLIIPIFISKYIKKYYYILLIINSQFIEPKLFNYINKYIFLK